MKYIKRFRETKLSNDEWKNLLEYTTDKGFYKICTPFDEESVDRVIKDNFDILKIASAYIDDWPLLEKIVEKDIDIIASVGGEAGTGVIFDTNITHKAGQVLSKNKRLILRIDTRPKIIS